VIRSSRLASVALIGAFASAAAQRSTISAADFAPRADSLVYTYLAESRAPSAAFAVIRGNDTLAFGAHGLADVAAWRAPTAMTIYEIGSITKQFTSSAIMRLVDQGKLKLDDDMSKYVPQFPLHGKRVSIRQLLNHTSGIHSYTSSPEWQKTWSTELSPDAIVKFVAADSFDFAPGAAYRYNNTGYVLLGMVIEKVTGQKYASYLDAQFFKPLGLRQTSYCPSKTTNPAFALGYSKGPKGTRAQFLDLSHPFAAGALCSTVGDLAKWQRALDGGKVVSPASYALMTTADTLNNGRRINYGFGLIPGMFNGHKTISHTGGINGFATAATYVPDDSLSIVVYTNFDGESPQTLVQNLLRVAYGVAPVGRGAPRGAPTATPTLSTADRDAIVGTYALQLPGGRALPMKIFLDGSRLMAQAEGQAASEIQYLGNYAFGIAADPGIRLTFTVAAGTATKVTLLQGGATMEGSKAP